MRKLYKREAYYLDEDVLYRGYCDKYGFHPYSTFGGFSLVKKNKNIINKELFF